MWCSPQKIELHTAENRWVRPKEALANVSDEEKSSQELYRKFQGILNKLTPQKFQKLAEQALKLEINSQKRLKVCIDKIFTKVSLPMCTHATVHSTVHSYV